MPSLSAGGYGVEARVSRPGGVAQLGERLNGIQEVSGSIPLVSIPVRQGGGLLVAGTSFGWIGFRPAVWADLRE